MSRVMFAGMVLGVLFALIVVACTSNTPLAPAPAAAPPATSAQPRTNIATKFNANYGKAPAAGWKWGVAEITTGPQETTRDTARHGFAWIYYVVRGSTDVGGADGKKTYAAGEAVIVPAQKDHTHRYAPQSQILVFRPADRPFGDFHQGNRLWESDAPLSLTAGRDYAVRIGEYTLAPGVANLTAEGHWGYVVEGTLTVRAGGAATAQPAGKVFSLTSSASVVLNNEGSAPVRFIVVGLH